MGKVGRIRMTFTEIKKAWDQFDGYSHTYSHTYNQVEVNAKEIRSFLEAHLNEKLIESVDTKSLRHWDAFSYFSVARSVFGFVTPTLEWAIAMKQVIGDKTVLEVGAGTGLVAKYLHEAGVNIISTDDYSWHKKDSFHWKSYYPVENLDFRGAIRKYKADFLLTCWAMYESPMAREAAELFTELNPEGKILYIGEGRGGCTASDDFFNGIEVLDYLEDVNTVYPQWFGLHDECWLVKWIGINENESSE